MGLFLLAIQHAVGERSDLTSRSEEVRRLVGNDPDAVAMRAPAQLALVHDGPLLAGRLTGDKDFFNALERAIAEGRPVTIVPLRKPLDGFVKRIVELHKEAKRRRSEMEARQQEEEGR